MDGREHGQPERTQPKVLHRMRHAFGRLVGVVASGVLTGVGALVVTAAPAQAGCITGYPDPATGQFVCTQTSTPAPPKVQPGQQNIAYNGSGSKQSSSGRSDRSGGKKGPTLLFNKNAPGQNLMTAQTRTGGCGGALTATTVNRQNQVTGQNRGTAPTAACAQPQQRQQQPNAGPPPPQITPQQAAQTAMAKLQFTAAGPGAGPTSADNDLPFDAPVGYPVWLWANGGTTADRAVSDAVDGMAVQINVHFDRLTWDAGDGTGTFTCGTGTEWVKGAAEPAAKSPTCDHVYEEMGRYTITATTRWTITWAAGGQTGTQPMAIAQSRPFSVGELQTVLTT